MEITSQTAVWYHSGKPPVPIGWVLIRDPQEEYETLALLSTSLERDPLQIVSWFVQRWQVEVTFEEVRAHLGVETQRQWSDKAIERTTPILLGLFSWVTLAAHLLVELPNYLCDNVPGMLRIALLFLTHSVQCANNSGFRQLFFQCPPLNQML